MPSRLTLVVTAGAALTIGTVAGYYAGRSIEGLYELRAFATDMTISYYDSGSRVIKDIGYLTALRSGDTPKAIAALEGSLNGELAWISTYHLYMPAQGRCAHVYEALDAARAYVAANPLQLPPGAERTKVESALAMRPENAPVGKCGELVPSNNRWRGP
jgi:hypothetical protein